MTCFDTSIVISILQGNETVSKVTFDLAKGREIVITSVTEYELLKHFSNKKQESALGSFLSRIRTLSFDKKSSIEAARIYKELKSKGTLINENDILISAICIANGEELITEDRDFERLKMINIKVVK